MYDVHLECALCKAQEKTESPIPTLNVNALLASTGWARANIRLKSGKRKAAWICPACIQKHGLDEEGETKNNGDSTSIQQ